MQKLLLSLFLLFIPAFLPAVTISCPLPPDAAYCYLYHPVSADLETLLPHIFPNGGYTARFVQKTGVFRVFSAPGSRNVVETGYPGYIGIRMELPTVPTLAEMPVLASQYLGYDGLKTEDIQTSTNGQALIYRVSSLSLDGLPVIFDEGIAGPGAEMTVAPNTYGGSTVWLKCARISVDSNFSATNLLTVRDCLEASQEFAALTVTEVKACYWMEPDGILNPALIVKDSEGGRYVLDRFTGQAVPRYREKTGR